MRVKHEVSCLFLGCLPQAKIPGAATWPFAPSLLSLKTLTITPSRPLGPWGCNGAPTAPSLRYCTIPYGFSILFDILINYTFIKFPQLKFAVVSYWGFTNMVLLWRFGCMIHLCIWQILTESLMCARHGTRLRDAIVNGTDQIPATRRFSEGYRK